MAERVDVNDACAQAAWMLVQMVTLELVKTGTIDRDALGEHLDAGILASLSPASNPAQRAAGTLLAQVKDMLRTADRRGAN